MSARYKLKAADATHLATAVGADRFITNKQRGFPQTMTEVDITYPVGLADPPPEPDRMLPHPDAHLYTTPNNHSVLVGDLRSQLEEAGPNWPLTGVLRNKPGQRMESGQRRYQR